MSELGEIEWAGYDFIDLGAGVGGSMESAAARIGGRGLGLESDSLRAKEGRDKGFDIIHADLFDLPEGASVRYVVLDNVLEHLPTMNMVGDALQLACRTAREFVYIRHPSFEDEAYLAALGLKQYWNDWRGHPTHILLTDFMKLFSRLNVPSFAAHPVKIAVSSSDPTILPSQAPPDQFGYDEETHGPKPYVTFQKPVYYAFDIVAVLSTAAGAVSFDYYTDPETDDRRPNVMVKPGP